MTPEMFAFHIAATALVAYVGFAFGQHWPCNAYGCTRRRQRNDLAATRQDARG